MVLIHVTDGFCGYFSSLSLITQSVGRNLDLRDASASKNHIPISTDPYCIDLAVRHICVFEFSASSHYERDL